MNWDSAFNYGTSAMSSFGSAFSSFGQAKNDKANARIAALNREKIERNYNAQIKETKINKALNLASNRMDYILSGLEVGGGGTTTDLVQEITANVYNEDINMLETNKRIDMEIASIQEQQYKNSSRSNKMSGWFNTAQGTMQTAAMIAMLI